MPVMEIDRASKETTPADGSTGGRPEPRRPDESTQVRESRRLGWEPLAGDALLERLRVTGRKRPAADPDLASRLRTTIEHGIAGDGSIRADPARPAPVVVTKDRLTRVLACERHQSVAGFGERRHTLTLACGALIDVLFRQLVTVGNIDDPLEDGLAALRLDDRERELVRWIERLEPADLEELRAEVARQADGLERRWPRLSPVWLPRTQETIRAELADGSIQMVARIDLALGGPVQDEASVALVEIKSGVRRIEHRAEMHFYALVETLRSMAPPFVVATYYTRTGELDTDPVSAELLVGAARRTAAGVRSLLRLARGSEPRRTPNPLCGRCAALPDCDEGKARVELVTARDGTETDVVDPVPRERTRAPRIDPADPR